MRHHDTRDIRFLNDSTVVGYEIMNEPQPGFHWNFIDFSNTILYPFYARVIQAITGVRDGLPTCPASQPTGTDCAYPSLGFNDTRHTIFFEPMAIRNTFDFSVQDSAPFTTYTNIAYAPHVYTHVFTIDQALGLPMNNTIYPPSYDFAYTTAAYEALAMKAAVLVTEFGTLAAFDDLLLKGTIEAQERAGVRPSLNSIADYHLNRTHRTHTRTHRTPHTWVIKGGIDDVELEDEHGA